MRSSLSPADKQSSASRHLRIASAVAASLFALGTMGLFVAKSQLLATHKRQADVIADWVAAKSAIDGKDPYREAAALAARYGPGLRPPTLGDRGVHFRPPGSLVLLAPITLLDAGDVFDVVVFLNAGLVIVLAMLIGRLLGVDVRLALLVAPMGALMLPIVETFNWGSQSLLIAVLLVATWLSVRRHDSLVGGALLGVACALKLYPLLLVVPLFGHGRRRAAWTALGSFAALQLAAVALFRGVSLGRALDAMSDAGRVWGSFRGNSSLAGVLARMALPWGVATVVALGVGALLLWVGWKRLRGFEDRFAFTLLVATLVSPLSWLHYDVAIIAVAAWCAARRSHRFTTAAVLLWGAGVLYSWPVLLTLFGRLDEAGPAVSFAGRLLLIGAFALAGSGDEGDDRTDHVGMVFMPRRVFHGKAATP